MHLDFFEPFSQVDLAIFEANRPMTNIAQVLLSGEGYVTAAVRFAGADEKYITGDSSDFEKFRALCSAYPLFEGNVAQTVCQMILNNIFGINEEISEKNCEEIWAKTADFLQENPLTPTDLMSRLHVGQIGILTDIFADLEPFEKLGFVIPALCPDSVFAADKRGYKRIFGELERAFGERICGISDFDRAVASLTERFVKNGCSHAKIGGLSAEGFGKSDYFHAENAMKKAVSSDGSILPDEARDFRRYAIGKFIEICREFKVDLLLEFSKKPIEILPDITLESPVERRVRLNFSGREKPLAKEGFFDLGADLQTQISAYSKRCAIGNLPPFFVGTANLCELCLHGFFISELQKYAKKDGK